MDFIPFNTSRNEQQRSSPHVLKQNRTLPNGSTPNSRNKNNCKPSLGSSASFPSFGSPAIGFGSPAVQNVSFSPLNRQTSPRPYQNASLNRQPSPYQSTPRSYSPRHSQNSYQFTPPSFTSRQNSNGQSFNDNSNFKAPHQSFSPRGRGNGRKSFTRQFNQTPRLDPNCNIGGSSNIEDYYNPSMVEDPWRNMAPVLVSQASKS